MLFPWQIATARERGKQQYRDGAADKEIWWSFSLKADQTIVILSILLLLFPQKNLVVVGLTD
jgi:hypothetical protein